MKKITFAILLSGLLNFVACNVSTDAGAKPSATNNSKTEMSESDVLVTDTPQPQIALYQVKSQQPLIWVGAINFDNGTIESDGFFSKGDAVEAEFPDGVELGTTIKVDLMNCAGYLATAQLIYSDEGGEGGFPPGWEMKGVSETSTKDVQQKIKKCHFASEFPYLSNVFAVAPQNNKRKGIKIGKVDTRKLFASLDKETKEMANTTEKYVGREKNNLTLSNDNWTDIDGAGQLDLVEVSGNCGNEDYTCTLVFLLVNGKWKQIADIGPA